MSTFRHRARLAIFAEILKATKESKRGKKKADIARIANLSYPQASKFLNLLLANGLLRIDKENMYKPTEKGLKLVRAFESLNLKLK